MIDVRPETDTTAAAVVYAEATIII